MRSSQEARSGWFDLGCRDALVTKIRAARAITDVQRGTNKALGKEMQKSFKKIGRQFASESFGPPHRSDG